MGGEKGKKEAACQVPRSTRLLLPLITATRWVWDTPGFPGISRSLQTLQDSKPDPLWRFRNPAIISNVAAPQRQSIKKSARGYFHRIVTFLEGLARVPAPRAFPREPNSLLNLKANITCTPDQRSKM